MKFINILILSFLSFFASNAQLAFIDSTFGVNGKVFTNLYGDDRCHNSTLQTDGKIILVGTSDESSPYLENFAITRYTIDGILDTTFSSDGKDSIDINGYLDEANDVFVQPDGKILVTGISYGSNNYQYFSTVRYNPDGSRDSLFGTGGKVSTHLTGFVEYPSVITNSAGKIIVGGTSNQDMVLVQYNYDGSLDSSFGVAGIFSYTYPGPQFVGIAGSIAIQADGKIVFLGVHSTFYTFLMRINISGSIDSSFGNSGIVMDTIGGNKVLIQNDGKILTGGMNKIMRFNTDGSADSTFGVNGRVFCFLAGNPWAIRSISLQTDGKIVAGGFSGNFNDCFIAERFNTDGSLDSSFGVNGFIANVMGQWNNPFDIVVQNSERILVSGYSHNTPFSTSVDFAIIGYMDNINTGINSIPIDQEIISLLPNPFNNELIINCSRLPNASTTLSVTLYDIYGRNVLSQSSTTLNTKLKTESLSNGVYFIELLYNGNKIIKKVVKQ